MQKSPVVAHALLLTFGFDTAFAAGMLRQPLPASPTAAASRLARDSGAEPSSASFTSAPPVPAAGAGRRRGLPPAFERAQRRRAVEGLQGGDQPPETLDSEACEAAVEAGAAPVTSMARDLLWPANHSLIDVGLNVDPTPVCEGLLDLKVEVWADEPQEDPTGDGHPVTPHDALFNVPDLFLRAERKGDLGANEQGRVYLVITKAVAGPGVTSHNCSTVVVPHSGNPASIANVRGQASSARAYCIEHEQEPQPPGFVLLAEAVFTDVNRAPLVDAGPDRGTDTDSITIDATVTDDGLPEGLLELEWSQVSGPAAAVFSNPRLEDPTVRLPALGSYVFKLTATDGDLPAEDEVTIVRNVPNQAPIVDAGDDQVLEAPDLEADLDGSGSYDPDNLPNEALAFEWSVVSAPENQSVQFWPDYLSMTRATFTGVGIYVLRLRAWDGALWGEDTVTITINEEAVPTITVSPALVTEGHQGRIAAELVVALSQSWPRPVTFDYLTHAGTATAGCDYVFSYGTFSLAAGETTKALLVPVVGDLSIEPDETVEILLGNAVEGVLASGQVVLTIDDDDAANAAPLVHAARAPADETTAIPLPPTVSWSSTDPDPSDTVTHDLYLGSSVSRVGQSWSRSCPVATGPEPSTASASGGSARVFVLQQEGDGSTGSEVYVLDFADGSGGSPAWSSYSKPGGPDVLSARAAYDPATDRLIVVGRCQSGCTDGVEVWVLTDASSQSTATWARLTAPGAPSERSDFAIAHSPSGNRLYLFGGLNGAGEPLDELWRLDGANGTGPTTWSAMALAESAPPARSGASMVLDAARDRLLLFGGSLSSTSATNDVWVVEGVSSPDASWRPLETAGTPPTGRFGHFAAFDRGIGRMLVFGGTTPGLAANNNFVFGDVWLLDGDEWHKATLPSFAPIGRFDVIAAYAPDANRLLVAAGRNNKIAADPTDLWLLDDAMGRVAAFQLEASSSSFVVNGLDPDHRYFWKGVTRDTHGAWRGAPTWWFTANAPPTVDAGIDQTITLPSTAALQGTVNDDGRPAPPEMTFTWAKVSGPGSVIFSAPNAIGTTATFGAPGLNPPYVLSLTVSDGMFSRTDTVEVTVNASNTPPVVDAGPDQDLVAPLWTAQLAGAVSDDGLPVPPGATETTWTFSGPGNVNFTPNANDPSAQAAFDAAGPYTLTLTAYDGEAQVPDSVSIEVFHQHDLVVPSMDASQMVTDAHTLSVSGTVSVGVDNLANGPIAPTFVVKVFEDRNSNGTFEPAADNLLGASGLAGLDPYAMATLPVPVSGTVLFLGNRIHAFVDAEDVVTESNEANNYRDTRPPCTPLPPPPFDPVLEWSWTGSTVDPDWKHVMMTPAVADLNGDGIPEIIFQTYSMAPFTGSNYPGSLRAINGRTGADVFTVRHTDAPIYALSNLAVGNIDGDPPPEIVAIDYSLGQAKQVIAFEDDGTFKAKSPFLEPINWGGPTLADLDGDGTTEIVVGRQVLNNDLTLRWTGTAGTSGTRLGTLSIVADLDLDGKPEVIAGGTAYRHDGQVYWVSPPWAGPSPQAWGGYNATGNFDADPNPEIAVVAGSRLRILDDDGSVLWTSSLIISEGPPVVADVDGDGKAEVGVGGARYYMFDIEGTTGTPKWTAEVSDGSNSTASSVFDFDGDGAAEVVFGDERFLRIYQGETGQVLWQATNTSCTALETPVIADVDADGSAEIVVVANQPCYSGPFQNGIRVYGDADGRWVSTRKIWNQHAYHITNVNEDLTIPANEAPNWLTYNNYRQNRLTSGCEFARPDLTASYLTQSASQDGIQLTVRIGNSGGAPASAVPVAFYDADPSLPGTELLGTATTAGTIAAGGYGEVSIGVPLTTEALPVWVVADDIGDLSGTIFESDESNNRFASRLFLMDPPNQPPVVNAGLDETITLPLDHVDLQGSATDDGRPLSPLTVAWGLSSSEPRGLQVTFAPPDNVLSRATFAAAGTYELRLGASDGDKQTIDYVTVEVLADAPDLTVPSVDSDAYAVDPQTLVVSGQVSATVHNGGSQAAGAFTVIAYEEVDGQPGFDPSEDNGLGSITLDGLASQATTTAYVAIAGTVRFAGQDIRVAADATNGVDEQRETNNHGRAPHGCEIAGGCSGTEPDLVPSYVRIEDVGSKIKVTARIGNAGDSEVEGGIAIGFYDGPPGDRQVLGSVETSAPIPAGGYQDVWIEFDDTATALPIWVVADDPDPNGGELTESVESNNAYNSRVYYPELQNDPPEVDAGPYQVLDYPDDNTVTAATATDPEQDPLTYLWRQLTGPAAASIAAPTSLNTLITFTTRGDYSFALDVDDGYSLVTRTLIIHVDPANTPPVVSAGPDSTTPNRVFDLAGSVLDDGLPRSGTLMIAWTVIASPPGSSVSFSSASDPTAEVTVNSPGTYVFRITANDSTGPVDDDVQWTATFSNQAPTVQLTAASPIDPAVNPTGAVSGTHQDDGLPLGSTPTYTWSAIGPGHVVFADPHAPTTTATYTDPGPYEIRLRVSDGELGRTESVPVVVLAGTGCTTPPVAEIAAPLTAATITEPTTIHGTATAADLASWQLEHRLNAAGSEWTRFASGTSAVPNGGVLGTFDPTLLLNGAYAVRLTVRNTCGVAAHHLVDLVVRDNFKVGHFTVSFVDMEVPVAGIPLQVTRTYDSRDKRMGDFGMGWRLSISSLRLDETGVPGLDWKGDRTPGDWPRYCLVPARAKVVTVTMPDGRVLEFDAHVYPQCQMFLPPSQVSFSYDPRPTTRATLVPLNGGVGTVVGSWPAQNQGPTDLQIFQDSDFTLFDPERYELRLPDGRKFVINSTGLESITDLNGNVLTVTANGIQHSSRPGEGIQIVRVNGRVTEIKDPQQNAVTYAVNADNDLVAVTDRENNTTTFTYDPVIEHHLRSIKDPMGRTPIRNEYDDDGRLVKHTDADAKTIEYVHDIANKVERIKDRNDAWRYLKYDDRGNVVLEGRLLNPTDQNPAKEVVERGFDGRNLRESETVPRDWGTPNPLITRFGYDPVTDVLLNVTDPENRRTEYTYNARDQVLTVKDPNALAATPQYLSTENSYNATTGNLEWTKDGEGTRTDYTYRPDGNVETQTVRDGSGAFISKTRYEYAKGVLTKEENLKEDGTVVRKTEFVNGIHGVTERKTWRTPAPGQPQETLVTTYVYNLNGQLWKTYDADSATVYTETEYNDAGQPLKSYDKSRRVTEHLYDDMGRLRKTIYPGGSYEEITYWPEGQRRSFRDRMGNFTHYCYDEAGRLAKTRPPQDTPVPDPPASPCSTGVVVENVYDPAGRLWNTIDAEGNLTEYEYWDSGRRKKVFDPENGALNPRKFTFFEYDANGNLQYVTDPKGERTEYEYDKANRRTKTRPPIVDGEPQREMTTAYVGRTRIETDLAGKVTTFENDELGQLVKVTNAHGKDTTYGYDEVGNRISQTDARARVTRFEYDKLGRETKRILPGGDFETKTYTVDGSLDLHTDFNGHTTDYDYDPVTGRLAGKDYADATMPDVAFTYYPDGRRETVTVGTAQTLYDYDLRRRLKLLQYPDGRKLEYLYDHNGNRTSLKATLGPTVVLETLFSYDGNNRLEDVTDPDGRPYTHGYDPNGNRETLDYPNLAHTQYLHDEQNRLEDLTTTRSGSPIQSYAFTLYPAGNRHTVTEAGGIVRTYGYDDLYRLTSETVTGGPHQYAKVFTYDDVGNRETQTTTGGPTPPPGAISYGYDDRDRLRTETGVTGGYEYDFNGNLIDKADGATDYAWDRDNRLTTVTLPDGTTVSHAYDADGNRVQTTTTPPGGPPAVTNYLVDTSGSLSHVVAETDAAGALTAYYVRGDDLLAVMRPTGPTTWATKYVHADGIGSIRKLTDENGAVTDTYAYSAFGELIAHTGTDPQPYAFAGEPYDPNSGFQYHRARWMDPRTGRFTALDLFPGSARDPKSLHKYSYGGADPVGHVDPTGFFSLTELTTVTALMTTIFATSANVGGSHSFSDAGGTATVWIRSFAPWAVFGTVYEGDNRGFSTSRDAKSRIWAYATLDLRTSQILDRNVGSDPSRQIWPMRREANGTPTMSAYTTATGLQIDVAGNNPLFPGSADVDLHLRLTVNKGSTGKACFSGSLTGDGFPNAEVFVAQRSQRDTMIHTFETTADPDTGPYRLLPFDIGRDMGSFSSRCQ